MSLALHATGLCYSRNRAQCAARLQGGEVVTLTGQGALDIQWPPDIESIYYVPEAGVFEVHSLERGKRQMTRIEISWCDAILRHLCGPSQKVGTP